MIVRGWVGVGSDCYYEVYFTNDENVLTSDIVTDAQLNTLKLLNYILHMGEIYDNLIISQ